MKLLRLKNRGIIFESMKFTSKVIVRLIAVWKSSAIFQLMYHIKKCLLHNNVCVVCVCVCNTQKKCTQSKTLNDVLDGKNGYFGGRGNLQ